ncbi:MAG: DUF2141 domain-containing protein [Pseudomonadota bacterium]
MLRLSTCVRWATSSAAALAFLAAGCAHQGGDELATLELSMIVTEPSGAIMVAIFDSAESYNGGGSPVRGARVRLSSETATTVFKGLPPGSYAVRAFHDQNGDGTLNTNPLGALLEPFAFSNNAIVQYGPPAFEDAALTLKPGANSDTLRFSL